MFYIFLLKGKEKPTTRKYSCCAVYNVKRILQGTYETIFSFLKKSSTRYDKRPLLMCQYLRVICCGRFSFFLFSRQELL